MAKYPQFNPRPALEWFRPRPHQEFIKSRQLAGAIDDSGRGVNFEPEGILPTPPNPNIARAVAGFSPIPWAEPGSNLEQTQGGPPSSVAGKDFGPGSEDYEVLKNNLPNASLEELDDAWARYKEQKHWAEREGKQDFDIYTFLQDQMGIDTNENLTPDLQGRMQMGRQNPMDWDGKIYEEMGEGQSPRVVAEGLAADPEDPTPRMGSFPPIKAKRKKTFYLPPLKRYQ